MVGPLSYCYERLYEGDYRQLVYIEERGSDAKHPHDTGIVDSIQCSENVQSQHYYQP